MRADRTSAVNSVRSSPPQSGNAAGSNLPGGRVGFAVTATGNTALRRLGIYVPATADSRSEND